MRKEILHSQSPNILKTFFVALIIICSLGLSAQISVTVTGNTNATTAGLPLNSGYSTLAGALTALNAVDAMTGPVTLTCAGGTSETAPVKGLVIGSATLNPQLNAVNTITINTSGGTATLNAGIGTANGPAASPDGMLYLFGADYVTIDGLTFTDANTTNATVAMEFGLAFFKRTVGDGCNFNRIQNCTFNMQRINNGVAAGPMFDGSWAIEVLNSTPTAATTALTPTNGGTLATNGTNSNNKFYLNSTNNGNGGIGLSGFAATAGVGPNPTATTFLGDINNDIGGTDGTGGNTILNFGGGAATNPSAGIRANNQWSINISYNSVNNDDGTGVNHATTLRGIFAQAGISANATINNNTVRVKSAALTSVCTAIDNAIGSTGASNTVTISNNLIQGCTYTTATTGTFTGILSSSTATNVIINNNTVRNNSIGATTIASACTFQGIYSSSSAVNLTYDNNKVFNNSILNQGGTLYAIRASTSLWTVTNNQIYNNTIPNHGAALTASNFGIYDLSSPTQETITGNQIYSNTITGSSTSASPIIGGIYLNTTSTSVKNISSNLIYGLSYSNSSTGSCVVYGIYTLSGNTIAISKNKIYDLSAQGAGSLVNGLFSTSGTTFTISNNLIGDLRAPSASGLIAVNGMNLTGTSTLNVYFNTINLNATSTATTFGTSGIYFGSGSTLLNLRNNIIVNASTPGQEMLNVATNGITAGLRRSGGTTGTVPSNYSTASNNNIYWVAPSIGTNNHLSYVEGTGTITNPQNTVNNLKAFMVNRDQSSAQENVNFISTTGSSADFLHIDPSIATQIESGGTTGTGITDDFDGFARTATPDIGADEGTFTPLDLTSPSITYTNISNTSCLTNPSLIATITDPSGVNSTSGTKPRIYFKKSTDADTYAGNTSSDNGWKYSEATNSSSPFSFSADLSLLQSPVITNDIIQYFIVAQDNATTPNVGINSGIFNVNPVSVALTSSAFPLTGTVRNYTIVPVGLSGTVSIGAAETYTSLTGTTGLFNAINTSGLSGNLTVNIVDASITETGTVALNQILNTDCAGGTLTVVIKPSSTSTVTGSLASNALIRLNGADNVTIDGSNSGGTDKSLTITNTATTAPSVISISSLGSGLGATNNTIKNCNLSTGIATTTGYGISIGGATPGVSGADNDNTTIQNNNISIVPIGIYSNGTASISAGGNDNLTINSNSLNYNGSLASYGIQVGNGLNSTVSQNTINLESSFAGASTGISIETGFNTSIINANNIIKVLATNSGGEGGRGITVGTGMTASALTISNNMIAGVNGSNWSAFGNSSSMGIAIGTIGNSTSVATVSGGISVVSNSISMSGSMGTGSTSALTSALYIGSAGSALTIRNNVFSNTQIGTNASQKNYAIYSASPNTAFTTINNNDYFVSNTFNTASAILGFIGSDRATLSAWITGSGQDANSYSFDPKFIDPVTNLHVLTTVPTIVESNAVNISGITTDIDGDVRNVSLPDIGADEGNFIIIPANEISATALIDPTIGSTKLVNSPFSPQASFTNNGSTNQVGTTFRYRIVGPAPSTTEVYNMTATSSILPGGIVTVTFPSATLTSLGSYTVYAASELVGDANTANDEISGTFIVDGPMCNTYAIGASQPSGYQNLTQLSSRLNSLGVSCQAIFELQADYDPASETFPITINAIPGASAVNNVIIRPASGVTKTITGVVNTGAIIKLNGTDFLTIDGSNNGSSSNDLTIVNNTTTTTGNAVLWITSAATGNGANNNLIKNLNIEGNGSLTTFTGLHVGGTTIALTNAGTETNNNNIISSNLFRKSIYGITMFGWQASTPDNGNRIQDNTLGTSAAGEGFSVFAVNADRQNNLLINGNDVQNVRNSVTTSNIGGLRLLDFKNGQCYNNLIHNLNYSGVSTAKLYGIAISSSTYTTMADPSNALVYNNMIYDMTTSATGTTWNLSGILAGVGYGDQFYHNTVNLTGQLNASTSGLSAAFAMGDANITGVGTNYIIRNNIFSITGSSGGAGGNVWAIYTPATSLTGSVLNNNDYYTSVTSAINNVGRFNAVNYPNLAGWQTATSQDANSFALNPQILSATDSHISTTLATIAESTGTPIGAVGTDIDGDTRNATTPDLGADEGTFIMNPANDLSATAFLGPLDGGSRLVGSSVTPVASFSNLGINAQTSAPVRFRIEGPAPATTEVYNDVATVTASSGQTVNVTFPVSTTAFATTGTYTMYAIAELPGDGNTSNDQKVGTVVVENPLCGNYLIGASEPIGFKNLTQFSNKLNNLGVSCAVVAQLKSDYSSATETWPILIQTIPGSSATNTVKIKPATGVTATISGSAPAANGLIYLINTDYLTLDGSNNGTDSKDLTITNTQTGVSVGVFFQSTGVNNGATNDTIKNVIFNTSSTTTGYGVYIFGADHDNNGIINNTFNNYSNPVYSIGTSAGVTNDLAVKKNTIVNNVTIATVGVWSRHSTGTDISENTFDITSSGNVQPTAIALDTNAINANIYNNKITKVVTTATGGYAGRGITVATNNASSNINIYNNFIAGINGSNWTSFGNSSSIGIALGIYPGNTGLTGVIGGVNIYNNSINLQGDYIGTSTTVNKITTGLYVGSGATALNIRNNIFVNRLVNPLATAKAYSIYSAYATGGAAAFTDINYNVYNVNTANQGVLGYINGADVTTLSAWQTATSKDANSIISTPTFVSATDLHLVPTPNAAFDGTGTPIALVTKDIDNALRNVTTPDLGADEFERFATINLTAFVEGYYNTTTNLMEDVLSNSMIAGATSTQCDTFVLQLRAAITPFAVVYADTAVIGTNGQGAFTFPAASVGNSYYLAVQHRSALETWSAAPLAITATTAYNFSTASTQAYGGNMVELETGVFGFFMGDIETPAGDGSIDFFDYSIWETDYNNFESGYRRADLNGDGSVDFFDYPIWETNYNNFISVMKP